MIFTSGPRGRLLDQPGELLDPPDDRVRVVQQDVDAIDLTVRLLDGGLDLAQQRDRLSRIASIVIFVLSRTRKVFSRTKRRPPTRISQPTARTIMATSPPVRARTVISAAPWVSVEF
jgi:hypothetical protein